MAGDAACSVSFGMVAFGLVCGVVSGVDFDWVGGAFVSFSFGKYSSWGVEHCVLCDPAWDVSWGRGIGVLSLWLDSELLVSLQTGFGAIVQRDVEQVAFLAGAVCRGGFLTGLPCLLAHAICGNCFDVSVGLVAGTFWGCVLLLPLICGFCLVVLSLKSCHGTLGTDCISLSSVKLT